MKDVLDAVGARAELGRARASLEEALASLARAEEGIAEEEGRGRANAEVAALTEQLIAAERRATQLTSLYVATHQLYTSDEPDEVEATIGEIAVDLLGAEHYALLLRDDAGKAYVARSSRLPDDAPGPFARGVYDGGVEAIDRALDGGGVQLASGGEAPAAVVPLRVQGSVVGALVLVRLLDHKTGFSSTDREILDMLAAHAASALLAARAWAEQRRKLQTFEELKGLLWKRP